MLEYLFTVFLGKHGGELVSPAALSSTSSLNTHLSTIRLPKFFFFFWSLLCCWSSHFAFCFFVMRLFCFTSLYYNFIKALGERKDSDMFSEYHLESDMLMIFFLFASSFLWASWGPQEWNGVWQRVHSGDQSCVQLQRRLPPPGRCRGHSRVSGDRPLEQPQCPPTVCPWVLGQWRWA